MNKMMNLKIHDEENILLLSLSIIPEINTPKLQNTIKFMTSQTYYLV